MAGAAQAFELPGEVAGARVLVVVAPYHRAVTDLLLEGARAVLARSEVASETVEVPGALEIPTAIAIAAESGRFDAYVALGCVLRGETIHFDLVAGESCRALAELGIRQRLPIGNGILTVDTLAQAVERADPARQDKGGHAARAALALLALARRWQGKAGR